jgi:DNA helicase-2/ATP-dependent DNA helicase PcrA
MGQVSVPSRFLFEIPAELMVGPQLQRDDGQAVDDAPLDVDLAFGARRTTRFGTPVRSTSGGAWRQGSGRPGAPRPGEAFQPSRDLAARRSAYAEGAPSGSLRVPGSGAVATGPADDAPRPRPRPIVPGERQFRDGDRVRHPRWGDGIVVSSKLTRDDEEVTVGFRDTSAGRKTLLASIANLELIG